MKIPGEINELPDEYTDATSITPAPPVSKEVAKIIVARGQLSEIAHQGEHTLIDAGVEIYQRGGELVRPVIETVDAARQRKTQVARFLPVNLVYLRDVLGRHATWERYDARAKKLVATDPPREVAEIILARSGEWWFRHIAGVITTPTLRPDGSLLTKEGYDPDTRLLLVDPPTLRSMPDAPTSQDALEALAQLESLLVNFPFVRAVVPVVNQFRT